MFLLDDCRFILGTLSVYSFLWTLMDFSSFGDNVLSVRLIESLKMFTENFQVLLDFLKMLWKTYFIQIFFVFLISQTYCPTHFCDKRRNARKRLKLHLSFIDDCFFGDSSPKFQMMTNGWWNFKKRDQNDIAKNVWKNVLNTKSKIFFHRQ